MTDEGIIDEARNPFATSAWIAQGYGLTKHRRKQLEEVLDLAVDEVLALGKHNASVRNRTSYPAFVAVRWGFAEIRGGVLVATQKWREREGYDEFGRLFQA